MKTLKESIEQRRSYYVIGNEQVISDAEIQETVEFAVKFTPSAFNSQTARAVVLLGNAHRQLWEIVKTELKKVTPQEHFERTEAKINTSFAAGYGTVLFYEEQDTVNNLQKQFPLYADNFPVWSEQSSGIAQFAVWTMLEDAGFGVSLQHYNPLIDNAVAQQWNIPQSWKLRAQMPFGNPLAKPEPKEFIPIEERVKIYK